MGLTPHLNNVKKNALLADDGLPKTFDCGEGVRESVSTFQCQNCRLAPTVLAPTESTPLLLIWTRPLTHNISANNLN